jgi:hypothetical protein
MVQQKCENLSPLFRKTSKTLYFPFPGFNSQIQEPEIQKVIYISFPDSKNPKNDPIRKVF